MLLSKQHNYFPVVAILIISSIAYLIQASLFVNWDVSWDLLGSQRMLAHGTYVKDFFDMNPPLIIYLYAPAVFFSHVLHKTLMAGLNIYVFSLAIVSLLICYKLCDKIFLPANRLLQHYFFIAIALVFLVLPLYDWGQREHLMLILTLPYFLAAAYRLQNNLLSFYYALGIGLMAAIGFAIKPYFLVAPALLELYYIIYQRRIFACMRAETLTLILFMPAYLASIYLLYPDYISTVVPYTLNFYYTSIQDHWAHILTHSAVWFCYFAATYYVAFYHKNSYRILSSILLIGCMGFLFSYFLQRTRWDYHIYPAYALALLLFVLLFGLTINQKYRSYLIALLGLLIFVFPIHYTWNTYLFGVEYKKNHVALINYMQNIVHNDSTYSLSAEGNQIFPAALAAKTAYNSRFMHLFWLPGLAKLNSNHTPLSPQQQNAEKDFIKMIIEDISTKKPAFLFVDTKNFKPYFSFIAFDHLAYFYKDPNFRTAMKPYCYVATIEQRITLPTKELNLWNILVTPQKKDIDPKKTSDNLVVLTGADNTKTVYVILRQKFVRSPYAIFSAQFTPTKEQQQFLANQKGVIKRTTANNNIINQIVERVINPPKYRFQVYRRYQEKS